MVGERRSESSRSDVESRTESGGATLNGPAIYHRKGKHRAKYTDTNTMTAHTCDALVSPNILALYSAGKTLLPSVRVRVKIHDTSVPFDNKILPRPQI